MLRFLISIMMVCLLSSCAEFSSTKEKTDQDYDHEEVISETTKMLHEYHTAMRENGLMAEFQFLDDSKQFFWVPPGFDSKLGYDSVKAVITTNANGISEIDLHWESLEVFPLAENLASYTGIVIGTSTDTSGIKSELALIESGTLIKREDGWKLLNGQSALLPTE